MFRVNFLTVFVVVVVAFIASSLWYSPLLFGREFLQLSGMTASAGPNVLRVVCEFLRTFVLACVLAYLVVMLQVSDWKRALQLGLLLWIAFPVVLLTGSMLWQNVPWQLAAIHAGDWLIECVLITVVVAVWPKKMPVQTAG